MKRFFFFLSIAILITRLWALSIFIIFRDYPHFLELIINDSLHHYHVGLLLIVLSYPVRRFIRPIITLSIGLGIVLEEWPVVLHDLGFNTLSQYHTGWDLFVILVVVFISYLISLFITKNKKI